MLAEESSEERDNHLESLWLELADIPMNPQTETIEAQFHIFDEGTHKEDIWRWFDQHHSRGVAYLLEKFHKRMHISSGRKPSKNILDRNRRIGILNRIQEQCCISCLLFPQESFDF